jgi:hypothetical protein
VFPCTVDEKLEDYQLLQALLQLMNLVSGTSHHCPGLSISRRALYLHDYYYYYNCYHYYLPTHGAAHHGNSPLSVHNVFAWNWMISSLLLQNLPRGCMSSDNFFFAEFGPWKLPEAEEEATQL